jgi:ribonuclease HI
VKPPLRTPLGVWKPTLDQREWNTLVSAQTSPREVFRRLPDGSYEVFEEVITRKSSYSFWVSSTVTKVTDTLPFDVVPAEMQVTKKKRERCKIIHRGQTCHLHPVGRRRLVSLDMFSNSLTMSDVFLSDCVLTEKATQKFVSLICSPGSFSGGTDGGLLNELGTFGFVWGNHAAVDELLPVGKGHVPGESLIMSSTRTELCGLFAAITHLRLVVEYYHIIPNKNVSCRIYCDSKAALARVVDKYYDGFGTTWRCRTHYDLKVAIRTCLLQLPISISWRWVRGHASRRKERDEFTFPKVLNETADDLATEARISKSHADGR